MGLNSTVLLTYLNRGQPQGEVRFTSIVRRISKAVQCSYDLKKLFLREYKFQRGELSYI